MSAAATLEARRGDVATPLLSIYDVTPVEIKFCNRSKYDRKYIWISTCFNMSDHAAKDKRHMEASLTDISTAVAGPPNKFTRREGGLNNPDQCLTFTFVNGGGIDVKFSTKEERDFWQDAVLQLVMRLKQNSGSINDRPVTNAADFKA